MWKYLNLFFVLALALSINTNLAHSQDATSSLNGEVNVEARLQNQVEVRAKREAVRMEMEEKREEIRVQNEVRREEVKERIGNLRDRVKEESNEARAKIKEARIVGRERALERFDKVIEKLENLKDRINGQIVKLEAKGVDVLKAKNSVALAEAKLSEAKTKVIEINALLTASIDELSLENKTALRTLAQEIQGLLKETHRALLDAIKSLKEGIRVSLEARATAEVNANSTQETDQ